MREARFGEETIRSLVSDTLSLRYQFNIQMKVLRPLTYRLEFRGGVEAKMTI